jgi:ubiquinone/menaquinone biosynthesis C-methylase UbiE
LERRKESERTFHDFVRGEDLRSSSRLDYYTSNMAFYSVVRKSRAAVLAWLQENARDKEVLDFCCGEGRMSLEMAGLGARRVVGIDLSRVSLDNAVRRCREAGLSKRISFCLMDGENMGFTDATFDLIHESGALHHLRLGRAYAEMARVLKPEGRCICIEALRHNPIIQYYRRRTPHLRTQWEAANILGRREIIEARRFFGVIRPQGFFHLATLAAVPFRKRPRFHVLLSMLERIDDVILKAPLLRWAAWQAVFVLENPVK